MGRKLRIPKSLIDEQLAASNPAQSAWVSANAGSGKTHVLTQRVVRLMLDGNAPDRILCLTFTKAAAANMKNRVFETLASWTMLEEAALKSSIIEFTGDTPSTKKLKRARQLFAEATDTPGGLKIQTIHAFCESLLHQFPLEANIAGHFSVIQDITREAMLDQARANSLFEERGQQAFKHLAASLGDSAIEEGIAEIIANRFEFRSWLDRCGSVEKAVSRLYPILGLANDETLDVIQLRFLEDVASHDGFLETLAKSARHQGKANDLKLADAIAGYLKKTNRQDRIDSLAFACLTSEGEPRAKNGLVSKAITETLPDAVNILNEIGMKLITATQKLKSVALIENSQSLFLLAEQVLNSYERAKSSQGVLDYDDLIRKSILLLERRDIRDWIRYRLDQGIDHLLVDEAQDTSPAQWQIINTITEDFHSGEGAAKRNRTIFVVGDEKQSIYSFQGADPKEFARQQDGLIKSVTGAGRSLKNARLDLSFRSTKDVLHAVDLVFRNEANARGLTQSGYIAPHDAVRSAEPGDVQVWPLFGLPSVPESTSWLDPVDRHGADDPAVKLAERISSRIKEWVGKPLPGTDNPLKFGDILVLVRKRDRFITALTRTLKDMGIAVAGADRLRLLEHIAVEDLVSAGKYVLLPQDDLNLASFLKSIFIDIDEDELFELAHNRDDRSLYEEIVRAAGNTDHRAHNIASKIYPELTSIRERGRSLGPFGFYAWLLGSNGGRKKLLSRLGMEAEDVIDAFLDEILDFVRDGGTSLETFIAQIENADPEIKRELELNRDEVRILTTHASKGLEAKCVFLVDSCGKAWISNHRPKVMQLESEGKPEPFVWIPRSSMQVEETLEATEKIKSAAEAEYRRLLYVGMTRAADRLIVCGYHGSKKPDHTHWHQMVHDALEPGSIPLSTDNEALSGFRWTSENRSEIPFVPTGSQKVQPVKTSAAPDWLFRRTPNEPSLPPPLKPSGANALIDEGMKSYRRPAFEREKSRNTQALEVGDITHKLLEVLPAMKPELRVDYVERFIASSTIAWTETTKRSVLNSVLDVLNAPQYQRFFSPEGLSEVPILGSIETRSGTRAISGQIDRLVIEENNVWILDFKTGRTIPSEPSEIPDAYVTQLALYRHMLMQIYPDHEVTCFLLWTSGPTLSEIPVNLMDRAIQAVNNG